MPPAGQPWTVVVLAALEARLATIQGDPDYYNAIAQVRRVRAGFPSLTEFPGIEVLLGDVEHERRQQAVSDGFANAVVVQLNALDRIGGESDDISDAILRLARDVHTALLNDHTLGGTVEDVRILRTEPFYPSDPDEPLCGAAILVELPFVNARDNLNAVA